MEQFYNLVMALVALPTLGCFAIALANLRLKPKTYYKHGGHRWTRKG